MKNRNTNWKGVQSFGARKPELFRVPHDVNVKHMSMGSWHADSTKEGARRKKGG